MMQNAAPNEGGEKQEPKKTGDIRKYDFVNSERLTHEQSGVLRGINAIFAQRLAKHLTQTYRCVVEVEAEPNHEITGKEFIKREWGNTVFVVFVAGAEQSRALLALSGETALSLVDSMLGGANKTANQERPLTQLERKVFSEEVEILLGEYAASWVRLFEFAPVVKEIVGDGLPEEDLAATDRVVLNEFSIKAGDRESKMTLCLLLPSCEGLIDKLHSERWATDKSLVGSKDQEQVARVVAGVELPVTAVLGSARVSLSDLVAVEVGDVICLDGEKGSQVVLWTGGRPIFTAAPVTQDGEIGVKIEKELCGGKANG